MWDAREWERGIVTISQLGERLSWAPISTKRARKALKSLAFAYAMESAMGQHDGTYEVVEHETRAGYGRHTTAL